MTKKTVTKAAPATAAERLNIFVPIMKVDAEQRLVYGTIASEQLDKSGEQMDYATSKANFQKWSDSIHEASGGLSLGNVREMHTNSAVGKVTSIDYQDDAGKVVACTKVVDDAAWKKVEEGVYTGFSIGGRYEKRWTDNGVKKYTALPNEVSLVDNPCIGDATFEYVKADHSVEMRKFHHWEPNNTEIMAEARTLAKAAGKEETMWDGFITESRSSLLQKRGDEVMAKADELNAVAEALDAEELAKVEPAAPASQADDVAKAASTEDLGLKQVQLWTTPDGKTFEKKADARAHAATLTKEAPKDAIAEALAKAEAAAKGETPAVVIEDKPVDMKKSAPIPELAPVLAAYQVLTSEKALAKGMYSVGRFADMISQFNWLFLDSAWEEQYENDEDSQVPAMLYAQLKSMGAAFIAMATEEVKELIAGGSAMGLDIDEIVAASDPVILELAAPVIDLAKSEWNELKKVGKRNSAADQKKLNTIHDHAKAMGADCPGDGDDKAEKLAKAEGLAAENETLAKRLEEVEGKAVAAIEKVTSTFTETVGSLNKRIADLEAQPAPSARETASVTITKDAEGHITGTTGDPDKVLEKALETMSPEEIATRMFKSAQQRPKPMMHKGMTGA